MNFHARHLSIILFSLAIVSHCNGRDRGDLPLDFSTPETLLQSLNQTPTDRANKLKRELKQAGKHLSTLVNANKENVLHLAIKDSSSIKKDNLEIIKAILNADPTDSWALISARDKNGDTSLIYVAKRVGREFEPDNAIDAKIARLLLTESGENAPRLALMINNDQDTALQWAVLRNPTEHIDLVKTILNTTGVDRVELVFNQDDMRNTALHMAANNRHIPLALVKDLVQAAGDRAAELINLPGEQGRTALSNAKSQVPHRRKSDIIDYLQSVLKK